LNCSSVASRSVAAHAGSLHTFAVSCESWPDAGGVAAIGLAFACDGSAHAGEAAATSTIAITPRIM
jgi:hypothetical protein